MAHPCYVCPLYCEGNIDSVHMIRVYEGVKVQLHLFLQSPVNGGECPASRRACLIPVRSSCTKWRYKSYAEEKKACSNRESNHHSSDTQSTAQSLYWFIYPAPPPLSTSYFSSSVSSSSSSSSSITVIGGPQPLPNCSQLISVLRPVPHAHVL
jgi:hypothetical protein